MLCGSSPTATVAMRVFVSGRNTLTLSSLGLTTQISRSLREMAIGLEEVGRFQTSARLELVATRTSSHMTAGTTHDARESGSNGVISLPLGRRIDVFISFREFCW